MTTDPASVSTVDGARIVLGVTGGIAAYKAVEVCRRLVDAGHHVSPIMTADAHRFIGETTLSALASEPVQKSLWSESSPIPHTRLGQNADLIVVAPATARLLADYTTGRSGDLLIATLIATRAPVVVCPAMHTEMWEHPSVQDNLATLRRRGVIIVEPESGRLAGGDIGHGRLADPARIVEAALAQLGPRDLEGLHVVVSAGGTREPIDPVRYIGNRSSGKQGHAIAAAAQRRGARVTLVTTRPEAAPTGPEIVSVATAAEMHRAVTSASAQADVVVMAAAVADFQVAATSEHKLKKTDGVPEIHLEPTVDILAELGRNKPAGQTLVGFAAETENLERNALAKLEAKGADLLVANDVSAPGAGFEHDTNAVVVLGRDLRTEIPLTSKDRIANSLFDAVLTHRVSSNR